MGTGRKKIPIRHIENVSRRRVTFCKRRNGLFKKSRELSILTPGCRVAVLAFSASSTGHFFDTDETHDLVSFLEQAADAVFGNPNFQIPTTSDSLLVEKSTADPISNPNFEIGSTSHSLLVQGASAVNDKGDTFSNPTSEAIGEDRDLNLGDKERLCLTEEELLDLMGSDESPVSICASPGGGGSCSINDFRQVWNNTGNTGHGCYSNAMPRQVIFNSSAPVQQCYYNYSPAHDIIPNSQQYTFPSYTDADYMRNYVPMELMMQFASSSNATSTPSNTGLWNDELLGLSQFSSGDDLGGGCSNEDECLSQLFLRKQRLEALRQYMLLNVSSSFWDSQSQVSTADI